LRGARLPGLGARQGRQWARLFRPRSPARPPPPGPSRNSRARRVTFYHPDFRSWISSTSLETAVKTLNDILLLPLVVVVDVGVALSHRGAVAIAAIIVGWPQNISRPLLLGRALHIHQQWGIRHKEEGELGEVGEKRWAREDLKKRIFSPLSMETTTSEKKSEEEGLLFVSEDCDSSIEKESPGGRELYAYFFSAAECNGISQLSLLRKEVVWRVDADAGAGADAGCGIISSRRPGPRGRRSSLLPLIFYGRSAGAGASARSDDGHGPSAS